MMMRQKYVWEGGKMNTGEKVKAYCKHKGISIASFAAQCGISHMVIYMWTNGTREPNSKSLKKLEQATGIPMREWLEDAA